MRDYFARFPSTNRSQRLDFRELSPICYGRATLRFVVALLLLLACLPVTAQDADALKKFAGTWEAKLKDKVICTIRVKAGDPISGETDKCTISTNANGDLQEAESNDRKDKPSPMINPTVHGDTLTFEEEDGDDVLKLEMKVVGDGQAELTILDSPVPIKPIHFARK